MRFELLPFAVLAWNPVESARGRATRRHAVFAKAWQARGAPAKDWGRNNQNALACDAARQEARVSFTVA